MNGSDPTGLCNQPGTNQSLVPGPCEFSNINWVHQAEDYLQSQNSGGFSITRGLEGVADFYEGAANSVVSGVTLEHVHIAESFPCVGTWQYTAGGIYGLVSVGVLGGAETEAPSAADEFGLGIEGSPEGVEPGWGPGTPKAGQPPDDVPKVPTQSYGKAQVPSWVTNGGYTPYFGETPAETATRIMNEQYGEGNWSGTGPGSEYSQILKWASRHFG